MADPQTDSPPDDRKAAWKARSDRGPHTATFPSGAELTFIVPDSAALIRSGKLPDRLRNIAIVAAAHPEGADGYMADLAVTSAISSRQGDSDASEAVTDAIERGMELTGWLIAEMLVDPQVTADEVLAGDFPELDVRMLLEFAERKRNVDAVGRRLPIVKLDQFESFRDSSDDGAGDRTGGGDGDPAARSDRAVDGVPV